MWIQTSGLLSDSAYLISTPVSSHLLVEGDVAALIDTGVSALVPTLLEEVEKYLGDLSRLKYICLTHGDFDHVGGLTAIREAIPGVEVVGSPGLAERLAEKAQIEHIVEENNNCNEAFEGSPEALELKACQKALHIDKLLGDGDSIDLGDGVEVKLFFTPGHTDDSVSYFVPSDGILASGEAVGSYRGRDKITPCFTSSYIEYLESLDKLLALDVRALILPHGGALTGELSQKFLTQVRQESERLFGNIKEQLKQGVLVEEVVNTILPEWKSENISPEGPFVKGQFEALTKMVSVVAEDK